MNKSFRRYFTTFNRLQRKISPNELKTKQKNVSSHQWLSRQLSDPYVEKAKQLNYRCRSAFKLLEIDEKHKIFKRGQVVVDVGAAPGSWSQVIANKVDKGIIIAVDKQNIYPIEGVTILGNMDFTAPETQNKIIEILSDKKANVVVSDMAPKATGIRQMDNENIIKLCYSVLRFALEISDFNASLVVKLWQCAESKQLENDILKFYNKVKVVKPKSSRSDSAEIFLLGKEFKGLKKS